MQELPLLGRSARCAYVRMKLTFLARKNAAGQGSNVLTCKWSSPTEAAAWPCPCHSSHRHGGEHALAKPQLRLQSSKPERSEHGSINKITCTSPMNTQGSMANPLLDGWHHRETALICTTVVNTSTSFGLPQTLLPSPRWPLHNRTD